MLTIPNMVLVSSQAKSISCDMHSENIHNFMPKMFCSSFDFCLSKSSVLVSAIVIPDLLLTNSACNQKSIFLFFNQNICCGYSKELSHSAGSFEHTKHKLKLMVKKIYTILRSKILFVIYSLS